MKEITRRSFLTKSVSVGLGYNLLSGSVLTLPLCSFVSRSQSAQIPCIKKGVKQLFVDDVMIARTQDIIRRSHAAHKLERPVLEADMPWEQGKDYNGKKDRRIYIYGTVLRDKHAGLFRMWYNRALNNYYAISDDGINWQRPVLDQLGENNMIKLFDFHSPSIIPDNLEPDPAKRYKAIGSKKTGISEIELSKLKEKFEITDWYKGKSAYCGAYSADGLHWEMYPEPLLVGSDTITLAQDPVSGEYLAFHKRSQDPRVTGRQVFLSVSKDMLKWSEPVPVVVTDETDHRQARLLGGGTHAEIYNMSAFPYGGQWLGLITLFRRTGGPKVIKGPDQSKDDGPIDVQLVHSRDGRIWERCSDRSPVIPLGPYGYDSGSILGVCNSPVLVGDEMWMYYTAMTTTHGGYLPDKELSIARASWRLDGMVSLQANEKAGMVESVPFIHEGNNLYVNTDVSKGKLMIEVLDPDGAVMNGFEKEKSLLKGISRVKQLVCWDNLDLLPKGKPVCLRFYLEHGDLYSYMIN